MPQFPVDEQTQKHSTKRNALEFYFTFRGNTDLRSFILYCHMDVKPLKIFHPSQWHFSWV